ncbi:hypothetical protein [Varunaivibrio sulfuroxidans]|uniref:Uncharacterized protein n=1 Tax=Varunaivibrio sulfuroxidans TaxID=1773489 RepID=A0A4R3J4W5_9PROT|nr:hypothetical protein [Varunaivibrio sulfuroxidans]TCS60347.1 hypothetical protein EDD55_11148 [Varunaivibrio sulfuroxidans]WES30966.1 hypothetical protein P3M64_00900 [Varunaivibrio sulfuroxidans]
MPPRKNPLKLNKLQLRTLALMQELARHPDTSSHDAQTGESLLTVLPHPHGDHVHVGGLVVSARDASGFQNEAVWIALQRKGLIRAAFPRAVTLTAQGKAYDTGLLDPVAQPSDH